LRKSVKGYQEGLRLVALIYITQVAKTGEELQM